MNQVFTTLPDDRPITAICVVENADKCPKGFTVVSKTYDQDSDADLWRESGFFARKCTRYLCISKTEGSADRVVESISVVSEKELPAEGFSIIANTLDTGQKAWRKKRLCYKLGHAGTTASAVTDIIVLSRMKKPPEEFLYSGEMNGMTLCHKIGKNIHRALVIPYGIQPAIPVSPAGAVDYVNTRSSLSPQQLQVTRRAPAPPPPSTNSTYATISGFGGLDGVPFVLNPSFSFLGYTAAPNMMPTMLGIKTSSQIDEEFHYDFRAERTT